MTTELIKLEDGTVVEIACPESEKISGGFARKVSASLDVIQPILNNISRVVSNTWKGLRGEVIVDQAEIEIGLSFGAEGNVYITKSTAGANLSIKLIIRENQADAENENKLQ